jgi:hypothetical protein
VLPAWRCAAASGAPNGAERVTFLAGRQRCHPFCAHRLSRCGCLGMSAAGWSVYGVQEGSQVKLSPCVCQHAGASGGKQRRLKVREAPCLCGLPLQTPLCAVVLPPSGPVWVRRQGVCSSSAPWRLLLSSKHLPRMWAELVRVWQIGYAAEGGTGCLLAGRQGRVYTRCSSAYALGFVPIS